MGSKEYMELFKEARSLYSRNRLDVSKEDKYILTETNIGNFGTLYIWMGGTTNFMHVFKKVLMLIEQVWFNIRRYVLKHLFLSCFSVYLAIKACIIFK